MKLEFGNELKYRIEMGEGAGCSTLGGPIKICLYVGGLFFIIFAGATAPPRGNVAPPLGEIVDHLGIVHHRIGRKSLLIILWPLFTLGKCGGLALIRFVGSQQ